MPGASDVEIRTLEVNVKEHAQSALNALEDLAEKLESIGSILDNVCSKAKGLASFGKGGSKSAPTKQISRGMEEIAQSSKEATKGVKAVNAQLAQTTKAINPQKISESAKAIEQTFEDMSGKVPAKRAAMMDAWAKGVIPARFIAELKSQDALKAEISQNYQLAAQYRQEATASHEAATAHWERVSALQDEIGAEEEVESAVNGTTSAIETQSVKVSSANARASGSVRTYAAQIKSLNRAAQYASKAVSASARRATRQINAAMRSATRSFKSASKEARKMHDSFDGKDRKGGFLSGLLRGRSLGQFIGLMVFRRAIMAAMRAIVNGIKEGSDNLVQYSAEYNHSISSITSALSYLKNAWAAGFAPIINVVAPYLQAFIKMIADALNALGRFTAALTGSGWAVQAKYNWEDYAASLDKTASSTSGANKAAQEYKKTIMSFDQIHALNDQNSSGGSGGSGGGGGNSGLSPSDMFTTVAVSSESGIGKIIERIKELKGLFAEGFWNGFGDTGVIEEIKGHFESIVNSLKKIFGNEESKEKFDKWIESLAKTFGTLAGAAASIKATVIDNILGGMDKFLTEKGEKITKWWQDLLDKWTSINTNVSGIAEKFASIFAVFRSDEAQEVTAKIISIFVTPFQTAVSIISDVIDKLTGGIFQYLTDNEESIKTTIENGIGQLSVIMDDISEGVDIVCGKLEELYGWITDTLAKWKELRTSIIQNVTSGEQGEQTGQSGGSEYGVDPGGQTWSWSESPLSGNDLYNWLAPTAGLIRDLGITWSGEFLGGAKESFDENKGALGTSVGGVAKEILDKWIHKDDGVKSGNDVVEGTVTGTSQKQGNLFTKFTNIGKKIKEKFTGGADANATGQETVDSTIAGTSKKQDGLFTKFGNLGTKIKEKFTGGANAESTGQSTVTALKTGASEKAQALYDQYKTLGKESAKAYKKGINEFGLARIEYQMERNAQGTPVALNPKVKMITVAAQGGLFDQGELFLSREAGPELVGRIGRKTGVANNDQIVESVSRGVYEAVLGAMAMSGGNNSGLPYEINVVVKTQNDEVLARAVERGNATRKYRMGLA